MNNKLQTAVTNFVDQIKGTKSEGVKISKRKMHTLNEKLGGILPDWYVDLFTAFPIAGAAIYYPAYELLDEIKEYIPINIASLNDIYVETELYYPGLAIKHLGYFCFTTDITGSGDQGFTTNSQGDNPPVFLVYHDVSDIGEEIEKRGMKKIAKSISDFFNKAKPFDHYTD